MILKTLKILSTFFMHFWQIKFNKFYSFCPIKKKKKLNLNCDKLHWSFLSITKNFEGYWTFLKLIDDAIYVISWGIFHCSRVYFINNFWIWILFTQVCRQKVICFSTTFQENIKKTIYFLYESHIKQHVIPFDNWN